MKTDRIFSKSVILTIAVLLAASLIVYFGISKTAFDGSFVNTYFPGILFFCNLGLVGFFFKIKNEKKFNNLSFEGRCQQIAKEIKAGKRSWYINLNGSNYLAVPLSKNNMNEMGGGIHTAVSADYIKQLIQEGRVDNKETFETIAKYL